jgi:transglutaminase-like putative cysteine protease
MPRVCVTHTTLYRYRQPVGFAPHRLMLRPRDSHDLRVTRATLEVTPAPQATRWAHDVFSNSVQILEWDRDLRADSLRLVSRLELEHYPADASMPQQTIDPVAETIPFSYAASEFPDVSALLGRHHADPHGRVDAWARRFLDRDAPTPTMKALTAMTRAINREFAYAARDAEGTHDPLATLATGSGACRDFALLMMEACRSLGLAARFVSGYVYDEALVGGARTGGALVGGGATHAWCAIYLPGAGWVEFDPTNGLVAGRNLIRVCTARTPDQALPVAGAYLGAAGDALPLDIEVSVEAS